MLTTFQVKDVQKINLINIRAHQKKYSLLNSFYHQDEEILFICFAMPDLAKRKL